MTWPCSLVYKDSMDMDGRALLADYLSTQRLTVRGFAAKLGPDVPFSAVWAWALARNPRDQRTPSIKYLFLIEEATEGAVPARSWMSVSRAHSKPGSSARRRTAPRARDPGRTTRKGASSKP